MGPRATARLLGSGQHRVMELDVEGLGASSAALALDWALPAAVYCDGDELRSAAWPRCVRDVAFAADAPSAYDVEAPERRAAPSAARVAFTLDGCAPSLRLRVPAHVRYLPPAEDAAARRGIDLPPPHLTIDNAHVPLDAAAWAVRDAPVARGGPVRAALAPAVVLSALLWGARRVCRSLLFPRPGGTWRGLARGLRADLARRRPPAS